MGQYFFEGLDGAARTSKPRTQGLTMVLDDGMGMNQQADLIATGAPYIDFAKIAVGISRLLPKGLLSEKIAAYQAHDINPFPGGQFLEYAEISGKAKLYLPGVVEAGYKWVEVSDNLAPVSLEWKRKMIKEASEKHGLKVLGEVGRKEGLDLARPLAEDAKGCLDAGAEIILLEAAELVGDDGSAAKAVEEVVEAIGLENAMFELPGPWIKDVTLSTINQMRNTLLDRFGPNVNLANVLPLELISLEAFRRGLGSNGGNPVPREY